MVVNENPLIFIKPYFLVRWCLGGSSKIPIELTTTHPDGLQGNHHRPGVGRPSLGTSRLNGGSWISCLSSTPWAANTKVHTHKSCVFSDFFLQKRGDNDNDDDDDDDDGGRRMIAFFVFFDRAFFRSHMLVFEGVYPQNESETCNNKNFRLTFQTPGEKVFGPQKHTQKAPSQEVFERLGITDNEHRCFNHLCIWNLQNSIDLPENRPPKNL